MTRTRRHDTPKVSPRQNAKPERRTQKPPKGRSVPSPPFPTSAPCSRAINNKPPLKSILTRRPPLGDRDREVLALCEARRCELDIGKRETARRAVVDHGDVVRALNLQSATRRTISALARLFGVADAAAGAARATRVAATLIEIRAVAERQAELLGRLAELAIGDPPEL